MLLRFHLHRIRTFAVSALAAAACLGAWALPAGAQLSSYATSAVDGAGVTGALSVGLGVPDYEFSNDSGLGFGGTNTDVFDVGESVVLAFPLPLRNIASQHDAIISAFVGGLGATDNANVQVEASSDGTNFVVLSSFDTQEARNRLQDERENDFEGVKLFYVEFGAADNVTHIRLTNTAGTAEGFRFDAIEGLHPDVVSTHAFEFRIDRVREDFAKRFTLRVKNIGDPGAVPIREIRMINATHQDAALQETQQILVSDDGDFICVENCVPDNGGIIPFSRHVWSVDGSTEAPVGVGLAAGKQAASLRWWSFDTDSNLAYLSGYSFEVTFADGLVHAFDYDADVTKEIGSMYQKYLYFDSMPAQSWNRPVDYYEFISTPAPTVPGLSAPLGGIMLLLGLGAGIWMIRTRELQPAGR